MTFIYHITHIENIPAILQEEGLVCDAEAGQRGLCKQSIAHAELKERRSRRMVEKLFFGQVAAGGVLSDYVPFYFSNRSPMLYSIHTGHVAQYPGKQNDVVYLVSTAEAVVASGSVWCFTNGHAVEGVTEFYDNLSDLAKVDWSVIRSWSWKNTLADPDRKRRKQAEFLVHKRFPWELISQIGVINSVIGERVKTVISNQSHHPRVTVERDWYYS
ncbi:MAG TPA: DUF4433 domain-containing protein [Candidatus Acidoferrales bacterium]|jgi:hypothetical protein|nr:DUF4433 domain-containing protein [Candidatus Acidoferrales bacterium]